MLLPPRSLSQIRGLDGLKIKRAGLAVAAGADVIGQALAGGRRGRLDVPENALRSKLRLSPPVSGLIEPLPWSTSNALMEVEKVALANDGLLKGMTPGKVYFDLSTNSPTLIRQLHAMYAGAGCASARFTGQRRAGRGQERQTGALGGW